MPSIVFAFPVVFLSPATVHLPTPPMNTKGSLAATTPYRSMPSCGTHSLYIMRLPEHTSQPYGTHP